MSDNKWLLRHVYIDMHEIVFGEFPNILIEWIERLVERNGRFRETTPRN
jgi:hypothetical protein